MVPFMHGPNYLWDNGDWTVTGSFANPQPTSLGYALGSTTHTFDATSNPNYYLYKWTFYGVNSQTQGDYDAADYTNYTLRLKKSSDTTVKISNVRLIEPSPNGSGNLPVTVSENGTMLTVEDTKDWDDEAVNNPLMLYFDVNVEKFVTDNMESGRYYYSSSEAVSGLRLINFAVHQPYDTDYNYSIYKFTLSEYDSGVKVDSTATAFTLRVKKWERQYQPKDVPTDWLELRHLEGLKATMNIEPSQFAPVPGQTQLYEYVLAKDVVFPYTTAIFCGYHYQVAGYLDGVLLDRGLQSLTFTAGKNYYDLRFVPPAGGLWDWKQVTYVPATWRIRVTGAEKATPDTGTDKTTTPSTGVDKTTSDSGADKTTPGTDTKGTFTDKAGNVIKITVFGIPNKAYTGKQIKPKFAVTTDITDSDPILKMNTDYTVAYGKNKDIGKGTATIKGKGQYSGTIAVSFNIVPKKLSVSKVAAGKKQVKVTWKKASAAQKITKYQVRYRAKGTSKWQTKAVSAKKTSLTIKKLKKGKTYQIQLRAYKTVSKVKYYSAWSKTKTVRL
jgi:hypothetical protein